MSDDFDRELALPELLSERLLADCGDSLAQLLEAPVALLDAAGRPLWGSDGPAFDRHPLVLELEPLGYLATPAAPARAVAGARLLAKLLMMRRRYLMAARLHTEVVNADFAERQLHEAALTTVEKNQRQTFQTEKLASVAQLAAGIAHEINNPAGFVRSNLNTLANYLAKVSLLRDRLAEAETAWRQLDLEFVVADGADLIRDCVTGVDRIGRIVADLKGFSNVDRPEQGLADINEGLRNACAIIENRKPPGVKLDIDAGKLPAIRCLPGHLNQVFLNILTNALQAVGETGAVHVESRLEENDGAASSIVVRIRDDGFGIDPAVLPRVFDPFFTTHDVGQGTGLGLTVAHDIVQAHGGRIDIESSPGRGTLVTIHLPARS
jgi:signal transduction histidine kinase